MRGVFVVGSVKGAPGVTTSVLALAMSWPTVADDQGAPVVVEADAAGGDVAARFGLSHAPGLLEVAASARKADPRSVLSAVKELPMGVRVVTAPAGVEQCREAVRLLAHREFVVLRGQEGDGGTVLVDVGRLNSVAAPLLASADGVLVVSRGGADALSHVFAWCQACGDHARQVVLVVVGECPYSPDEVATTLGVGRVVFFPWDARTASMLYGRAPGALRRWRWRGSAPVAAAAGLAKELAAQTKVPPVVAGPMSEMLGASQVVVPVQAVARVSAKSAGGVA